MVSQAHNEVQRIILSEIANKCLEVKYNKVQMLKRA